MENNGKLWYAVMTDDQDQDWGTGSYDLAEATAKVKSLLDEYPDAYIAVIQEGKNPICIDEIRDL